MLGADPLDEALIPGVVGEGLARARVEDVLDEVGAAADDDDPVGRRVGDLDVAAPAGRTDVVGARAAAERAGQRGQVLERRRGR